MVKYNKVIIKHPEKLSRDFKSDMKLGDEGEKKWRNNMIALESKFQSML